MARNPEDLQLGVVGGGEYFNIPVATLGAMCFGHVVCGKKANGGVPVLNSFGRAAGETPPPFDRKSKVAFREGVKTLEQILAILDEKTRMDYMHLTSRYLKSRTIPSDQFFQLGLLIMDRVLRERKTFKGIAELDEAAKITSCPKGSSRLRNTIERAFYFWLNSFHHLMPEVPLRVPLGFQDSYIYKLGATRAKNAFDRTTGALFMADALLAPDNYQILIGAGVGSLRITMWVACLLAKEEEFFQKIGYSPTPSNLKEIRNFRRLISSLPRSALSALAKKIYLTRSRQGKTAFFKHAFKLADEALGPANGGTDQNSLRQFIVKAKEGIGGGLMSISDEAAVRLIAVDESKEPPQLYPLDAIRLVWAKVASRRPFYAPDVRQALKSVGEKTEELEHFVKTTPEEQDEETNKD